MKRLFFRLFEFYIQASIHVALAVVSLLYVFTLSREMITDKNLVCTLFFGTITGYNFVKYANVAKLYHRSLTRSLKVIQVFSLFCFLFMCFFAQKLPVKTLVVFGAIGILTFLYAVPLVASKNIRSVAGLKIYVVAFCWGMAVVIAPAVHYDFSIDATMIFKMLQVVLLVVVLIIPFDIRDLAYDIKQLKTIPQQLGVSKAKLIGVLLMFVFYVLEMYLVGWWNAVYVLPVCITTLGLLVLMPKKASKYYCSLWVESIPMIYVLIIIVQFF